MAERERLGAALRGVSGQMTTAVTKALEQQYPWFLGLSADERSWVALVAGAGINGFINWFAADSAIHPTRIFDVAPRMMARRINLKQTVDLVRTTVDVVREQLAVLLPETDRDLLSTAVTQYAAEVAFATAEVYAKEAESRGAWDEHIEAVVIDALVRADPDRIMLSRASTLGWPVSAPTFVMVGPEPKSTDYAVAALRSLARRKNLSVMAALHGHRLVAAVSARELSPATNPLSLAAILEPRFGAGSVVVGSICPGLAAASHSAVAALSGAAAAPAWPGCPRIVSSQALLPERALAGDAAAAAQLVSQAYRPLAAAGADLLDTLIAFQTSGASIEATARALYVHPNTVRYRVRRISEITGYNPADPRAAFALQVSIALGRLADKID
jgi:sugar diacid utilization regulator